MSRYWPVIKLLPATFNFEYVKLAKYAATLSVIAVIGSIVLSLFPFERPCGGLNCGTDFAGGTQITLSTAPQEVDSGRIRATLVGLGVGNPTVTPFGSPTQALIRFETPEGENPAQELNKVREALVQALGPNTQILGQGAVSAKISTELFTRGLMALGAAVFLMLVYIWFRFEWQFALGAIAGLLHDTILVFGLFAVTKMEFTLTAVAAILTVIGYSMNDTVVVFDRLRENLRKYKKMPLKDVINLSVNETLSRTIITGVTALMALAALAIIGGEALRPFSIALMFGIVFGTYSSIFVGAPIILLWGVKRGREGTDPERTVVNPAR